MKWQMAACLASIAAASFGQSAPTSVIVSREESKWVHEAKDPPGVESVFLREDSSTGGMELLVSFPAGHVFAPHWHDSNERIIVMEGSLKIGEKTIGAGSYAFLAAKEVQRLSCASKTKCVFYLSWDGNPKSRLAK